eukprot:6213016-Pleurochrysis_carterae.AAC.4
MPALRTGVWLCCVPAASRKTGTAVSLLCVASPAVLCAWRTCLVVPIARFSPGSVESLLSCFDWALIPATLL